MGEREVRMSGHRRPAAVAAAALIALVCGGSAFAATPQQIYRDVTDNGRLDGKYSRADIDRAFALSPAVGADAGRMPREPIRVPESSESVQAPRSTGGNGRRIPFSALDAALLLAAGGPVFLIGAAVRRRRNTPGDAHAVHG